MIDSLESEVQDYIDLGASNNIQLLSNMLTWYYDYSRNPEDAIFDNTGPLSSDIQPWNQLQEIATLTNSDISDDATCDLANDYIVSSSKDCPEDANRLKKNQVFDPLTLLGQKCCIKITDFDFTFYSERYVSNAYACRRAVTKISTYLTYDSLMTNKDYGVMHKAMNNILVFASTLKEARSSINYNIDKILKNLSRYIKTAGKTEMNANDFDCSGLKYLFEEFQETVCKTGL